MRFFSRMEEKVIKGFEYAKRAFGANFLRRLPGDTGTNRKTRALFGSLGLEKWGRLYQRHVDEPDYAATLPTRPAGEKPREGSVTFTPVDTARWPRPGEMRPTVQRHRDGGETLTY